VWLRSLWNWWEGVKMKIYVRETLGCCKQSSMCEFYGTLENQNSDRNEGSKDCVHDVLGGSKLFIGY
jgi:hypothetical protein